MILHRLRLENERFNGQILKRFQPLGINMCSMFLRLSSTHVFWFRSGITIINVHFVNTQLIYCPRKEATIRISTDLIYNSDTDVLRGGALVQVSGTDKGRDEHTVHVTK